MYSWPIIGNKSDDETRNTSIVLAMQAVTLTITVLHPSMLMLLPQQMQKLLAVAQQATCPRDQYEVGTLLNIYRSL